MDFMQGVLNSITIDGKPLSEFEGIEVGGKVVTVEEPNNPHFSHLEITDDFEEIRKKNLAVEDIDIIAQRMVVYGPPEPQWITIGVIQHELHRYYLSTLSKEERPCPSALGHLAAQKMAIVKIVRSLNSPEYEDNYCDGRNYLTIAQKTAAFKEMD